jgi:citrate synthase
MTSSNPLFIVESPLTVRFEYDDFKIGINLDQVNQYMEDWIDRDTVLAALGVKAQTLYAYVSRGQIEMRPDPADSRRSLYRSDDVAELATRRARGRRSSAIAASTLSWGEPTISTRIATIQHGQIIYRGLDAVAFAETATLEDAASLLWDTRETITFACKGQSASDPFTALAALVPGASPLMGRGSERWFQDASDAIATLAISLGAKPGTAPVHKRLAHSWSLGIAAAERIRRALVLMADHELNASTYAVRVAASTGASIAASLLAGLATLSGPRHGGASAAVFALLKEAEQDGPEAAISNWMIRHHSLPGFGHPLYPGGDPRATAILSDIIVDPKLSALGKAALAVAGERPNLDFALAALTLAANLPRDAGFRLFALGRSVGWAAHAMEQAATQELIRPRARYVGETVSDRRPSG